MNDPHYQATLTELRTRRSLLAGGLRTVGVTLGKPFFKQVAQCGQQPLRRCFLSFNRLIPLGLE